MIHAPGPERHVDGRVVPKAFAPPDGKLVDHEPLVEVAYKRELLRPLAGRGVGPAGAIAPAPARYIWSLR